MVSVAARGDAASDVHEGGDRDGDRRRHRKGAAVRRRQAHAAPAAEQRGGRAARAATGRGFYPRRLCRQADLPTRGRTARSNFFIYFLSQKYKKGLNNFLKPPNGSGGDQDYQMLTLDGLQALTDKMTSPESRNQVKKKKCHFFLK